MASTRNAMSRFARYLNPDYNPLPSSIISEGTDIWARRLKPNGLPDRFSDRGAAATLQAAFFMEMLQGAGAY